MDVTMILIVHGLRCAAILGVELLKQEQRAVYPETPLLPRSQTIQDLSVLANRLGATDPSDGAYSICQQGRKLVTRILDKILTPKPPPPPPTQYQHPAPTPMEMDLPEHFPAQNDSLNVLGPHTPVMEPTYTYYAQLGLGNDLDFMQWLQNTDMEQADVWNTF